MGMSATDYVKMSLEDKKKKNPEQYKKDGKKKPKPIACKKK